MAATRTVFPCRAWPKACQAGCMANPGRWYFFAVRVGEVCALHNVYTGSATVLPGMLVALWNQMLFRGKIQKNCSN